MRLLPARVALIAGPVVLAFFSGGFGDRPRLVALAVAALTLAYAAVAAPAPFLPRGRAPWLALGGLAALTGWVALSRGWAPLADPAGDDTERLLLYTVAVAAGVLAWRGRGAARAAEAGVAAGVAVVMGYALSGRVLPGIVVQHPSLSAGGRLEQPITYWNAEGALAALGFVLCARIAGDRDRPVWMRAAAGAAAGPLAAAVYLSFSRGAIVALAAGLIVLLVLAPTWTQLRAATICVEAGVFATLATVASPAVRTLAGDAAARRTEGLLVLAALLVVMAAAALLVRWSARAEAAGTTRLGSLGLPSWTGTAATVVVIALVAVPVLVGRTEDGPSFGATANRLTTASSNRYEYWKVAARTFVHHPVAGVGTGGFRVQWLRERKIPERVRDAHSLELETLAELGLVGGLLLAAFMGGVALCARAVQRTDPALAAGAAAALVVLGVHSAVDWDWELPAVSLPALTLAALLVARAGATGARSR